jgi:signal peptidase I
VALKRKRNPPRGFIAEWTVTILLVLFGTTTLVQAYVIPTGSMESTLLIGDHVLVDKLAYAPAGAISRYILPYQEIRRGDIIVFRFPGDIRQTYVKRVMGLPGDKLRIVDKELYLNGRKLNEPYKQHVAPEIQSYRDNFPGYDVRRMPNDALDMFEKNVKDGEVVVPPNSYFAMGDNRDASSDSRYWGFVPRENIIGKPLIIYWSYDASTAALSEPGIGADHLIDLALNFFTKTRWERTFKLVRGHRVE